MDAHYLAAPPPPPCSLCTGPVGPDSAMDICGDCKFLLLEDLDSPRPRTASSHHLLHAISVLRGDQPVPARARPSPSGSRRWSRVLSDSESEGFDSIDSFISESEPNAGSSRYRFSLADGDAGSLSVFGAESDASVDGNSVFEARVFVQQGDYSSVDSDEDSLDPMHAGLSQWDSDDPEEEEEDEWEEADNDEGASESVEASIRVRLRNFLISSGPDIPADNTMPRAHSSAIQRLNYRPRHRQIYGRAVFSDTEGSSVGGFDELLEHLDETDNSRRGAPPAAASFVDTLPRLTITENHERLDGLACAVCKDIFETGTEVNQLPCHHLYHPSCILPWLRSRNTCPLCRYELPIDDKNYEEQKRNSSRGMSVSANEDAFSYTSDGPDADEAREFDLSVNELPGPDAEPDISGSDRERNGRRWIFLAAPIVGLVGIVLAIWLGNPTGSEATHRCSFAARSANQMGIPRSSPANQRADRGRRWWSPFWC